VIAATSAFGKDVIPRLGGLLDVQPITDVIQIIVTCGSIYFI
jgi:electron transfer flavoprotein alpha subunit